MAKNVISVHRQWRRLTLSAILISVLAGTALSAGEANRIDKASFTTAQELLQRWVRAQANDTFSRDLLPVIDANLQEPQTLANEFQITELERRVVRMPMGRPGEGRPAEVESETIPAGYLILSSQGEIVEVGADRNPFMRNLSLSREAAADKLIPMGDDGIVAPDGGNLSRLYAPFWGYAVGLGGGFADLRQLGEEVATSLASGFKTPPVAAEKAPTFAANTNRNFTDIVTAMPGGEYPSALIYAAMALRLWEETPNSSMGGGMMGFGGRPGMMNRRDATPLAMPLQLFPQTEENKLQEKATQEVIEKMRGELMPRNQQQDERPRPGQRERGAPGDGNNPPPGPPPGAFPAGEAVEMGGQPPAPPPGGQQGGGPGRGRGGAAGMGRGGFGGNIVGAEALEKARKFLLDTAESSADEYIRNACEIMLEGMDGYYGPASCKLIRERYLLPLSGFIKEDTLDAFDRGITTYAEKMGCGAEVKRYKDLSNIPVDSSQTSVVMFAKTGECLGLVLGTASFEDTTYLRMQNCFMPGRKSLEMGNNLANLFMSGRFGAGRGGMAMMGGGMGGPMMMGGGMGMGGANANAALEVSYINAKWIPADVLYVTVALKRLPPVESPERMF